MKVVQQFLPFFFHKKHLRNVDNSLIYNEIRKASTVRNGGGFSCMCLPEQGRGCVSSRAIPPAWGRRIAGRGEPRWQGGGPYQHSRAVLDSERARGPRPRASPRKCGTWPHASRAGLPRCRADDEQPAPCRDGLYQSRRPLRKGGRMLRGSAKHAGRGQGCRNGSIYAGRAPDEGRETRELRHNR